MEKFEIDLDTESIWFADAWHTRDELAQEIREKLEAGNYQIAQPSQAIELLTQAISQMRILSVRVPPEMAEALEAAGQETGRTVNAVIRQLVDAWLSQDFDEDGDAPLEAEAMLEAAGVESAEVPAAENTPTSIEAAAGQLASEAAAAAASEEAEAEEAAETSWFSTASGGSKKKKR